MDQRDQEEIFPLQLLLEAANEQMLAQANKHNTVAAKLGPHAYEPVDVPDALSPIACCALGVASNLNIPFNYGAFTRTMTRYARAHETSPGQYPHLDVRCLSFCMTHPSSATIVRRFVDIVLGRSPMLVDTPTETSRSRSRNASHTDGGDETTSPPPQETSPSDDEVPDVEEADDDETDPDVLAEREQRRARRRLREAVDPNCLRALEHNLGMTFERQLRYIQDVKVKRGEGVRLGKEDAPLIDLDAEGFSALKAAGPKRSAAPKSTRAAQLKVLVAAGKIPSHRRGATAPPKQFAPRAEDLGWEVRAVEQSSVNVHQLVRQIQASHDALRNLLQLALDRTGVRMKSGVLIRTVMTQFINANHLAPLMSLFEVVLRSELPPIASATERVATKNERQRQADEQAKQAKTPRPEPATVTADESAPAPTSNATRQASSTTMVSTECQTSPTPTKVRIVYVKQNTTAANNATDATPRRTTSTEPPRRHMSPLASNPPNVRRDKPATTAQGAPRSSKLAPHDETVAANVAEQDYAAGIIQRVVRGRLSRKRVEAIRTQRQQAEAAPVAVPTAAASLPAPAQARGQHQLNTSTSSVSSSNLAAPTSRETPRRERRPPLALNDELRSSPVQQPPAKAWFEEDTEEAANPQHRAPATPDAVRPTTKPDSRQAPHDRRPLPKEDRHTLAAAAAPPHEHSRRTRSSEKDSPMITITDEQGSSREQDGDDDAYPQHHTMPTVQSAPAPRQQQQPPQQETRTRLPPVPIAASSTDVRPELQPALYQLAARYQIASGRPPATLPPIQRKVRVTAPNLKRTPGTAVLGADGKEYLGDIEVALGLKKTKAMREREELKRRERSEADYFARNAPASRLAATPQPDIVPPIRSEPPGAPLIAPVQRPPRRPGGGNVLSPMRGRAHPTSLTPEPTSTATVGGVPFDKLSRAQQHAVIRALAASMLDSDESGNTLATTQPSASAERLRKDSEQRRRDEEAAFNDFMLEQQQRALFEEQQRAKRQQQQLRHYTVA